jgi:hypothetical protein
MLLEAQVEAVGGGNVVLNAIRFIEISYELTAGGINGARNVMQFTGEDAFLEALRGGNLGA